MPQCRSCKAEIIFLKTAHGQTIPVNAAPEIKPGHTFKPKTMTSHFATCPDAARFRKVRSIVEAPAIGVGLKNCFDKIGEMFIRGLKLGR